MTEPKSFRQQAEQNLETTALQVARSIQTPGQTKEQTKRIAQGIAKGIALYKKQQSEKDRERERLRKKRIRQQARAADETGQDLAGTLDEAGKPSITAALWTAGALSAIVSGWHLWRWFVALPILLGTWSVPVWYSLPVAAVTGGLAVWLFLTAWKLRIRNPRVEIP